MGVSDLSSGTWLAVSAVIVLAILMILRFICRKMDYEIKLHHLTIEARRLRESYVARITADEEDRMERLARERFVRPAAPAPAAASTPAPAPALKVAEAAPEAQAA